MSKNRRAPDSPDKVVASDNKAVTPEDIAKNTKVVAKVHVEKKSNKKRLKVRK